jgi:exodeoxyribonuclease V beta subunit
MVFELPAAWASGPISTDDLAGVLEAHLQPGHPLAGYPARIREKGTRWFHGFLTGAIDLTARLGPERRFWVLDYKTNRFDRQGPLASPVDYGPGPMAAEMVEHDYVLQALFYQVALHRYLRLRMPGYDPAAHLGGATYLFVRGMTGPATPVAGGNRCGVFTWPADPDLIGAVDRLFAEGAGR